MDYNINYIDYKDKYIIRKLKLNEIHKLIETIKEARLDEALRSEHLAYRALRSVDENNIQVKNSEEAEVLRYIRNERGR